MARSDTVTSLTRHPPLRRKVPRQVREQQMLAVAERAFAERGFHGASVDAIALGVGVTKPMVYAYFGSKEGLYRACMARARERLFDTLRENVDVAAPPDEQLWHGLLAFFTFVHEQHDAWTVLLGEVTAGTGLFAAEGAEVRREIAGLVGDLLRRAAEEEGMEAAGVGLADQLARALIGAGESLAVWWGEHPDEPAERVALVLVNFAWNGLGGLVAGRSWTPRER
jgi:AcrR family transcriptional regulator